MRSSTGLNLLEHFFINIYREAKMSDGMKNMWLPILWLAAVVAQIYYAKIGTDYLLRAYPGH
jgi:hypothetical protein